jgi:hypothetical protein
MSCSETKMNPASTPKLHLPLVAASLALLFLTACATTSKQLERVAKDWCETIRASQVICVYPLTEDLVPGDVFLVQTPQAQEQELYRRKGFLALSDHRARLKDLDYKSLYFNGYWKDEFGAVPHDRPSRTGAGAIDPNAPGVALTEVKAPRAAFPSYSFQVNNQQGLGLAIPVKGIPVGLNFLHADNATGSLLIGDARTYAADAAQIYAALEKWLYDNSATRSILTATVEQSNVEFLLLRVISRVYLTGGMVVSLTRAASTGGELAAGKAPNVGLVTAEGNIKANIAATLKALEDNANSSSLDAGAKVKFLSASNSSVTLAESFDRMLAVGYLGIDVPIFRDGSLGAPIPTFERLENLTLAKPARGAGVLSIQQERYKFEEATLEYLAAKDPEGALQVMNDMVIALKAKEFDQARATLQAATPQQAESVKSALKSFNSAATTYLAQQGGWGSRYQQFSDAITKAYYVRVKNR